MLRIVLLAALALGVAVSSHASSLAPSVLFTAVRDGVLTVRTFDAEGAPIGTVSAIAVATERFVTLCSPLDGSDAIRLAEAGGRTVDARVIARDRGRNLCLLSASANARTLAVAPAGAQPRVGSRIYALSDALGFGVGLTEGVISGLGGGERGELLQFSAPVSPGSEGGALLDEQGRLIGVIDYRQREGQNVNFAMPAAWASMIEARRDTDTALQALRDRAPRLARVGDGEALVRLAMEWTRLYPEDADGWTWRAVAASTQGDFVGEEAAWRQAVLRAGSMTVAEPGVAGALLRQQRFAEAREAAAALVGTRPESAAAWSLLGQAHHGSGGVSEAETAYRKALALDPWEMSAHLGLISLAAQRGDHRVAAEGWSRLVRLYPSRPELRWRLVEALLFAQDGASAHRLLARLPPELADSADGLFWRGATAALLGRPQEASELFRASLTKGPSEPARAWTGLGKALFVLERFPEAIAAMREAVRIAPNDPDHRYWLAVALKDGGHLEEAIRINRDLSVAHPNETRIWRQLGYAQVLAARVPEGIEALERSLALDPGQPRVWNALMILYRAAGRRADLVRAHGNLRSLDATMAERAYLATIHPDEARPQ